MARPKRELEYSAEIRDLVARRRSSGSTQLSLSKEKGFPGMAQHFSWIQRHSDYARAIEDAKLNYADVVFEQCADLAKQAKTASDSELRRIKVQFDLLSYSASKTSPSKYAPQLNQTLSADSQSYTEALREINEANKPRLRTNSQSPTKRVPTINEDEDTRPPDVSEH